MSVAWQTIPHVTQFDKADVTELEAFRKRHSQAFKDKGAKLTPTVLVMKAVCAALKMFPEFNASLDEANGALIFKKYINLGIAVDTPKGLMVPVINQANEKNVFELAVELGEMAQRARDAKTSLNELQGGTFTISNLGGIGGTSFTPIINAPEVAILGLSKTVEEPRVINGQIVPRLMMPISVSYDHREIDGVAGARFTRYLAECLEDFGRSILGI